MIVTPREAHTSENRIKGEHMQILIDCAHTDGVYVMLPGSNRWGWKMKPTQKCQNLQFFERPLEGGSKSESVPIEPRNKLANFIVNRNLLTACYKTPF